MGKTLSITVAYNGKAFSGFARQPGQLTVQGSVEDALATVFARPVLTVCAGRTDAGVHARGQVVSFEVDDDDMRDKTLQSLQRSLQALTHEDISIRAVDERPDGFSARFDAVEREYHYHLCVGKTPALFMRDFCWHISAELDEDAMYHASRALIGEHDFKSFCTAASAKDKTTMRNVSRIDFVHETFLGEDVLTIVVVGNAFLHSMVRTIVGSLVLVGKHMREPEFIQRALDACDRQAAGENAPAQGLVFWEVRY